MTFFGFSSVTGYVGCACAEKWKRRKELIILLRERRKENKGHRRNNETRNTTSNKNPNHPLSPPPFDSHFHVYILFIHDFTSLHTPLTLDKSHLLECENRCWYEQFSTSTHTSVSVPALHIAHAQFQQKVLRWSMCLLPFFCIALQETNIYSQYF